MSDAGPGDQPTQPVPVVRAGRRRSGRRPTVVVVLVLVAVLVTGAAVVGVLAVVRGVAGTVAVPSLSEPPLLPGAPEPTVAPSAAAATVRGVGFDVSYPQCGRTLPSGAAFGIVGVNGGAPLTSNRCLASQVAWARRTGAVAVYVNTAYSGTGDPVAYGTRLAEDAIRRERAAGVSGIGVWWLDVEVTNTWAGTRQQNATVLAAMAVRLQEAGVRVGIYSSPEQWMQIAGDWEPGLPVWNATGETSRAAALAECTEELAGSVTALVQWVARTDGRRLDHDEVCPAYRGRAAELLDLG